MRRLLVSLGARYAHKAPAVWMLREACARKGLAVDVLEADIARPAGDLLRDILMRGPQALGFSCSIWNISLVERLTSAVKRALPGCFVIWGGPEVSYDAARRMQKEAAPDAIVAGEGEEALPALLLNLKKGGDVGAPGVVTRDSDGGVAPPVPLEKWVHIYPPGALAEPMRLHYAETARGCPFACRYCLSSVQGGVRALEAGEALRRLLLTRDAGARTVKVLDRTFNFDASRAREIWQGLIDAGGGAAYHFEIAAHLLKEEDIALLRRAPKGLFQLEIGVQTTGSSALEAVGRTQNFARIAHAVTELREVGNIHLHLDLIAGLPGDTYRDFARAVDDVLALRPHALQLGFLKLLPGSPLRADFDAAGLPYDPAPPYQVIASDAMTHKELCRLGDIEEVLSRYVNARHYARAAGAWLNTFAALEAVAQSLRAEGAFDAPRSQEASIDALLRALPPEAEADLRFDWLAQGHREYRPWMRPEPMQSMLRKLNLSQAQRRRALAERIGGDVFLFLPGNAPEKILPP